MTFDPDFGKAGFARHLFRLRFRDLKLSKREFAWRFGLSYSVVRDAEQGAEPSRAWLVIPTAVALPMKIPGNGNFAGQSRARAYCSEPSGKAG